MQSHVISLTFYDKFGDLYMNSLVSRKRRSRWVISLISLQAAVNILMLLNVPVARQVASFLFFTFVPGFLILKLLKLDRFDRVETILFSVGLSIAFLMFTGLLLNEFGVLLGLLQPLSLVPLLITLNCFVFVCIFIAYLRGTDIKSLCNESFKLSPSILFFVIPSILSIIGVIWANTFGNNFILLFMLVFISLLFVLTVLSGKLVSPKSYSFAIFMIAMALLFHTSLISNYVISFGSDVPLEYFASKTTENNAFWSSTNPYVGDVGYGKIFSMLSVTILPTIYSLLLNIELTWIFKLIFPLIFCFVPLGLYQLWKSYIGEKYAFISAFFFMAYATFYTEMLGLNRQIVAELFFVLLLLVILKNRIKPLNKMIFYVIFSFGLVTSHYGVSEIFLFLISLVFVLLVLAKRPGRHITLSMILFFAVIMFAWYVYTSNSAIFESFLEFGDYVYSQLSDFFNPASRGEMVLRGLGLEAPPTIWNAISRAFAYCTEFLIVIGFLGLVTKRVKAVGRNYFTFCLISVVLLVLLIAIPGLANTMNMTRFYHILLFFLAPLCVLGTGVLVGLALKRRRELLVSVLLLIVLVPYFLFQTGFVYEIVKTSNWSIPLSKYRMDILWLSRLGYIPETDVFGARWLSENTNTKFTRVYADLYSKNRVITIYSMIYRGDVGRLSNTTRFASNGTIFVGCMNSIGGKIVDQGRLINTSLLTNFSEMSIIYSSGACEIYRNMP